MPSVEAFPTFKYHPDPIATGSIKEDADTPCLGCNRIRGYIYSGPVFTDRNFILEDHLCPWCIADGTAASKFSATFNDTGETEGIPDQVRAEVEARTPGFNAWQQERWLACCGDAAAFLGVAGAKELEHDFPKAVPVVKKYLRDEFELEKDEVAEFFDGLSKTGEPSAYVFRCLKCNQYLAYVDEA